MIEDIIQMNSLSFALLASVSAALSNWFFRKNRDSDSYSPTGYLNLFYFSSFVLSLFLYPDIWETRVNWIIVTIGATVGFLNSLLMVLTNQALKNGPAGLTFTFQIASAVFPGIILAFLVGPDFGFSCTYFQLFGIALVIFGLFSGAKNELGTHSNFRWLKYVIACFIVQVIALTCIQARSILFNYFEPNWFSSDFTTTEADDVWFMPAQFGVAYIIQMSYFLYEKRVLQKREVIYGICGGCANFLSTALLLIATKIALPLEQSILFPCFAISTMLLCNIWANRLYKERFSFRTNAFCALGIIIAVCS